MFQIIKKFFSNNKTFNNRSFGKNKIKKEEKIQRKGYDFGKNFDGAKQLREMGKLGGKLVL